MTLPPTLRPILERFAYAVYLLLLVTSLGITALGWLVGFETGNFGMMQLALIGLALSGGLHVLGHTHWHFREWEDSLEMAPVADGWLGGESEVGSAAEFAELLARFEAETDVWRRGELRRELAHRLEARPALRGEFATQLAAHPEL